MMGSGKPRPHRNTCAPRHAEPGAQGKQTGRNHKPRVHSPEGVEARAISRIATYRADDQGYRKPGSRNPRKVGR